MLLDSLWVPGWIYHLIDKLTECSSIEPFFFVITNDSKATAGTDRSPVLFRCWAALDRWVRQSRTDALRSRDCGLLLLSRSIPVLLLQTRNAATLLEDDIERVKAAKLDLVLYLGREVPGADLSAFASLGAWSVQNGAAEVPDQFWDMYEGNLVTLYGPQIVEQKQSRTRVVYRSSSTTNLLSLALNQNAAYWEMAPILLTQLSNAERLRMEVQEGRSEVNASQHVTSRTLSNLRMGRFLVQWTMRTLRHELMKRLVREQWSIGLQPNTDASKGRLDHDLRIIRPPRDRFYADPFLIERNGRDYLFFEDYSFSSNKGVISCCELDAQGNYTTPRVVLERKYHLSYPFLFAWQGQYYMIPETRDNGTIEMYRAEDFPHTWVLETVLMSNVAATDSTLLYYHDKWWLFTAGMLEHASPNYPLWLFFSDSPMGPWTAHPKNPIVSDPTCSRPAGSLFFDNGELIRPGQDCSRGYGYAAHLHRVTVLSETDFQETVVASLRPDQILGSSGLHTFNQSANFRVVDCKFLISRFHLPIFPRIFRKSESRYSTSFSSEPAKDSS